MKKIIFLLYFFVSSVWADDAMVLIHGFGGDERSWHKKHIVRILQNDGWQVAAYGYLL